LSQLHAIRVARRAAAEIDEATVWWELNRAAAPGAIADEIERALALIRSQRVLVRLRATRDSLASGAFTSAACTTMSTTASCPMPLRSSRSGIQVGAPFRPFKRAMTPNPAVNTDAPRARLRRRSGSPVTLIR
jgi:hypothetical protein